MHEGISHVGHQHEAIPMAELPQVVPDDKPAIAHDAAHKVAGRAVRDATWPHMYNGRVLACGQAPKVPEHHVHGYESPDRALVGDEERNALAFALKRMEDDTKKTKRS